MPHDRSMTRAAFDIEYCLFRITSSDLSTAFWTRISSPSVISLTITLAFVSTLSLAEHPCVIPNTRMSHYETISDRPLKYAAPQDICHHTFQFYLALALSPWLIDSCTTLDVCISSRDDECRESTAALDPEDCTRLAQPTSSTANRRLYILQKLQAHILLDGTDHVAVLHSLLGDEADSILSELDGLNAGIAYVHQDAFKTVYDGAKSTMFKADNTPSSRRSLLRVDTCQ